MEMSEHQRRFAEWMRDHSAILYRVINAFAVGDDRHDLRQEVLLAVWKSIPHFRGQARPTTYLYRVSHNAALEWTRGRRNYRNRVERFARTVPGAWMAEPAVEADPRIARLYAAIQTLKAADRSLILLHLDGLTYREMAAVLGLSESNIGVKLSRLKTQLNQTLKGNDDHEPR